MYVQIVVSNLLLDRFCSCIEWHLIPDLSLNGTAMRRERLPLTYVCDLFHLDSVCIEQSLTVSC